MNKRGKIANAGFLLVVFVLLYGCLLIATDNAPDPTGAAVTEVVRAPEPVSTPGSLNGIPALISAICIVGVLTYALVHHTRATSKKKTAKKDLAAEAPQAEPVVVQTEDKKEEQVTLKKEEPATPPVADKPPAKERKPLFAKRSSLDKINSSIEKLSQQLDNLEKYK